MKTVTFPRACVVAGVTYAAGQTVELADEDAERVVWLGFAEVAEKAKTEVKRGRKPRAKKEGASGADNA